METIGSNVWASPQSGHNDKLGMSYRRPADQRHERLSDQVDDCTWTHFIAHIYQVRPL